VRTMLVNAMEDGLALTAVKLLPRVSFAQICATATDHATVECVNAFPDSLELLVSRLSLVPTIVHHRVLVDPMVTARVLLVSLVTIVPDLVIPADHLWDVLEMENVSWRTMCPLAFAALDTTAKGVSTQTPIKLKVTSQ